MPRTIPDKTRALVVQLYLDGKTNKEITEKTKVPASTIYWVLRQEGVPTRSASKQTEAEETRRESTQELLGFVERLTDRVAVLERQAGQLRTIAELVAPLAEEPMKKQLFKMLDDLS